MSVNKPWYEIGDLIRGRKNGKATIDEAALVIGVDHIYETYKLLPLVVHPSVSVLTNERMSFHVAHAYFQKV